MHTLAAWAAVLAAGAGGGFELVEVRKVSDAAPHSAFTDLIRFRGQWYCSFREGAKHVSRDGALRLLRSADGDKWEPAALLRSDAADLRDPKLSVTPGGKLMMVAAAAWHKPRDGATHQSVVYFSADGTTWDGPTEIGPPNDWLWRATWHGGKAFAVGYGVSAANRGARLYSSPDGKTWEKVADLFAADYPNEASLLFEPDGSALCLLRTDQGKALGQLGTAKPPYTAWTWIPLDARIGGPQLVRLADGRLVVGSRRHDGKVRTAVSELDPATGKLTERLALPSGGDSSYPGMVVHDGLLWVSYYSSHEGKAAIYLAKVRPPSGNDQ